MLLFDPGSDYINVSKSDKFIGRVYKVCLYFLYSVHTEVGLNFAVKYVGTLSSRVIAGTRTY